MKDWTDILGERRDFDTTDWELVGTARHVKDLEALVAVYWKPLYFFVRQHGYDNETAKDLVQGFLVAMIERNAFSRADPARGRFRSFLRSSLANYLKDEAKSASRGKRAPAERILSLDFRTGENDYAIEVKAGEEPDQVLNRAWARGLWKHALAELKGEPAHLEAFRLYLDEADTPAISAKTGLSESAAKTAIHRLKGRLREIIVGLIRHTAADQADLKAEVGEFLDLLSARPPAAP